MITRIGNFKALLTLLITFGLGMSHASAQSSCARSTSRIELDINNVRTTLHNGGDMWWTVVSPSAARYEIPKQDNPSANKSHSLFAGSVWLGGVDQNTNELLVIASTYRQSHYALWPGPVLGSGAGVFTKAETCLEWDRQFKVDQQEISDYALDYFSGKIESEEDIPESIRLWPGRNNPFLQGEVSDLDMELAPFIELKSKDGIYNPLDGDIPDIKGDQSIWWVMNDIGNNKEFGGVISAAPPIGMEIQVLAHAFATDDPLNDATLYNYKFINKSNRDIAETHISQWADPDLGFAGDDYVQSDVGRGLAICFNGDDFDESIVGYGDKPPAIGIDFFSGPLADFDTIGDGIDNDGDGLIDEADNGFAIFEGDSLDNDWDGIIDEFGERISMSNFLYYNSSPNPANGNPGSAQDFFSYMRSIWRDGTFHTHDFAQGLDQSFPRTNYFFPGNSWHDLSDRLGNPGHIPSYAEWDEFISGNQPADRRFLPSVGAFSMEPGALVEYTVGVPWAQAEFGGSRASFDKLLCADDYVQSLYYNGDIQFLNGPDAPDVSIRELENEVLLNLSPTPMTIWKSGRPVVQNTESYSEDDTDIGASYDFEGYLVYQLLDENVAPSDYKNPDRARLIFQCDLDNGVGQITDFSPAFESGQCYFNASVKVQGTNQGIKRSISVTEDAFSENSNLVNNKAYYYSIIAYGFNERANELNQLSNQNERVYQTYIESKKNIKVYKAIPHAKPGSIINFNSGSSFDIELISGKGNGGNALEFIEEIEDSILSGNKPKLIYKEGSSPLSIYTYDPFVQDLPDSIGIYLTSRLEYEKLNSNVPIFPGDTIISLGDYSSTETIIGGFPTVIYEPNLYKRQIKGEAVVIAERQDLETNESKTLEIKLLNEGKGGTFIRDVIEITGSFDPYYSGVTKRPTPFRLKNDSLSIFNCVDFENNDFWNIRSGETFYNSQIPISENREELIPELGLAVNIFNEENPGYKNREPGFEQNGFLNAEIEYQDSGQKWLVPINFDSLPWIEQAPRSLTTYDQLDVYQDVLNGSWTTWLSVRDAFADQSIAPGVAARNPEGWTYMQDLPNIDIVFTQDRSKWTRCPVLQMAPPLVSIVNPVVNRVQKSEKLSVDKDGNPDATLAVYPDGSNTLSRGYSWFPGYAIDLDKGIRLNMAFTENKLKDSIIGDDLLYNPNTNDTNNHYVIVTNLEYDFEKPGEESQFQRILDSAFLDQTTTRTSQYRVVYEQAFSWIGMMKISEEFENLDKGSKTDVRVKLRVNREYQMTEAGISPEWKFKLSENVIFSRAQMSEELERVRVVPNPYILGSNYENSFDERVVKITHLPPKCKIAIHGMDGSLIKSFYREYDASFLGSEGATQIWDLTNEKFQPINTGAYLIHIEADGIGEIVRKFFYVKRNDNISYDF